MKYFWCRALFFIFLNFFLCSKGYASVTKADQIYQNLKSVEQKEEIVYELIKSRYYFSAAQFAMEFIEDRGPMTQRLEDNLEALILKTGTAHFVSLDFKDLIHYKNSPSLSFILGIKFFNNKNYKNAYIALKSIGDTHRFSPEARMMQGSALNLLDQFDEAQKNYSTCIKNAQTLEGQAKNEKLKRYYAVLRESCIIHQARIYYKQKDFKKAVAAYEEIPKASYRWPEILLEKAWSNYYLEDFNRSLGLLVTYKSPLLRSYFFPEAEVLSALGYLKLCLWDDALLMVDQYYKIYRPRSEALKSVLIQHKNSHTYFLKLMFSPIEKNEKINPYIRNLITQIRKKVKFSIDLIAYKMARNELKHLKEREQTAFIRHLVKDVTGALNWRTKHLNYYIKKQMFAFINDIHRYSYEMFNIKLEIMSEKRDLLYRNKELISSRSRGDLAHVNRREDQHFWHFKGAFWADELGDYSFGLKSNCKVVDQKKDQQGSEQ